MYRYLSTPGEQIYEEENKTIRIALKHNNSLKTFPYAIQRHLAISQSTLCADTQSEV